MRYKALAFASGWRLWKGDLVLEAVMLVGGKGTRLRPLTATYPKPMLPVAGVPVTEHQIARAKEAGVGRIVLGTSYRAELFSDYFGNGERLGVDLRYVVEEVPLNTGGAIRNVASALESRPDDPVIVFNGDVLTGLDIGGLVQRWRDANADVALYLTRVQDPRAFGLVPTDINGRVEAFLEKPQTPEEIVTDQINAGCYVFRRSLIDEIPAGRPVSAERETFPGLLERGANVIGVVDDGYWLDLGTPLDFVTGSCDLVTGRAPSPAVRRPGDFLILDSAAVAPDALIDGGTTIGKKARVHAGARVSGSVIFDGAVIGEGAIVEGSVIGRSATIGPRTVLRGVVVGDRAEIGPDNELLNGARVFSGVRLSAASVRFSSDQS